MCMCVCVCVIQMNESIKMGIVTTAVVEEIGSASPLSSYPSHQLCLLPLLFLSSSSSGFTRAGF